MYFSDDDNTTIGYFCSWTKKEGDASPDDIDVDEDETEEESGYKEEPKP
jgi:hypothetical protein